MSFWLLGSVYDWDKHPPHIIRYVKKTWEWRSGAIWLHIEKIHNNCTHQHLCLVLLHGQNNFCLGQNLDCPGQKIFVQDKIFCPWLKSPFLLLKSSLKWPFLSKNGLLVCEKNYFVLQKDRTWLFNLRQKILWWTKMIFSGTN